MKTAVIQFNFYFWWKRRNGNDESSILNDLILLIEEISNSINPELTASIEKRNLILEGTNEKRDHLFELYSNSAKKFEDLEKKYLEETGIPKIKIKQNNRKILDPKLHKLANFQGGDIVGINKKLNEGYFSDLGINVIG